MTFPRFALELFSIAQLTDARIHALWHILILGILGLGNIEKLKRELAHAVWWAPDNTAALALNTACPGIIDSPLIEAGNIDIEGSAISLILVVLEADVSSRKRTIRTN